ncbi:mitochondrial import receptor subunit TOM20-like [Papaver somniferum]|uniref:mitochondrial import receptor subunit TOM20-like n=1 Tax=Papaver somniferum TaxID=3469 RepID=UPI000E6FDE83|nr:mitochondrial import receptor subunit TOM20-like [Papaver somniferum]
MMTTDYSEQDLDHTFDPDDSDDITRWGVLLLKLTQFQPDAESKTNAILAAISKLEEAMCKDLFNPNTVWWLGNAYKERGLMTPDYNVAEIYFDRAIGFYKLALMEEPEDQIYLKSLESIAELTTCLAQQAARAENSSTSYAEETTKAAE